MASRAIVAMIRHCKRIGRFVQFRVQNSNRSSNTRTMLGAHLSSSSSRPLRLCMRADLECDRQSYQGRDYWVIKDPISLKYYRFEYEEFTLLKMLDGKTSPEYIKQKFDKQFSPQKISLAEFYQFVGMLYRNSLLVSNSGVQGDALLERGEENKKRERRAALTNVLALRIRGFDPDALLTFLNRFVGWFFSIPAAVCVLLLALSAIALITTHWELFQTKLPHFQEFFASDNWLLLAITLGFTKVLHELGHGLSCKRFGGQCHEMGIMFLVLTPCLYCNVSDSWTLPNKWKRASIAAAGMYVEFFLASVATFVWWFSQPGIVNSLALNIVFVCSVSTLLFNANPLLRYDGYYILSDLIEIPNLRQKATTVMQRLFGRWILGLESPADPFLPTRHHWFFAIYSVAAAAYKWFITFAIFWFLYSVLEPYGFKIIGQMIALVAIYGLVGMPIMKAIQFIKIPGRVSSVKSFNVAIAAVIVLAVLIGILFIPVPHYIHCSLHIQPKNVKKVYVDTAGTVSNIHYQPNDNVRQGDVIIEVENDQIDYQIAELQSQVDRARVEYKHLMLVSQYDPKRAKEINQALSTLKNLQNQLQQKIKERKRLQIRAHASGIVMAPPRVSPKDADSGELSDWSGTPLDQKNRGAFLFEGTLVCEIVQPGSEHEAILAIDQTDIEFVQSGQQVEFVIDQMPLKKFNAKIERISPVEMKLVPKALSSRFGGAIVTTQDRQGANRPKSTIYQVSVPFDEDAEMLRGATGRAKIRSGSRTIGQRIWRVACETFRFHL